MLIRAVGYGNSNTSISILAGCANQRRRHVAELREVLDLAGTCARRKVASVGDYLGLVLGVGDARQGSEHHKGKSSPKAPRCDACDLFARAHSSARIRSPDRPFRGSQFVPEVTTPSCDAINL